MRRPATRKILLSCSLAAALATAAPAHATPWSMLGGSRGHPASSSFSGPRTSQLAWSFVSKGPIKGGAAIDVDGSIYVASANGYLFAVEQSGTERWRVKGLHRVVSVPVIGGDGRVYVGSATGKLYAFDAMTGAAAWTYDAKSPLTASPVRGQNGTLYLTTRKYGLVAIAADGSLLWQAAVGNAVGSTPAIAANGTIFVGTTDGKLVAVDPAGNIVWQTQIPKAKGLGTPVVNPNGRVYVGAKKGGLSALDALSGALLWTHPVAKPVGALTLGPNGRIVFAAQDKSLHNVHDDGPSATSTWTLPLGVKVASAPAVDRDGAIYLGGDDKKVRAVEPDGTIRWTFDTKKPVRSAIALGVGGRVIVGADDRSVYAIGEPRSGEDCWSEAFVDDDDSTPEEADRRFQTLLAACGGPGADSCSATVQGAVNADRVVAANRIIAKEIDPATYLALLRDRTRKLAGLRRRGALCAEAAADADGDLVPDPEDHCPGTPPLTPTTDDGCTDTTLPEAPSADLVNRYLESFYIPMDPSCADTVPPVPFVTVLGRGFFAYAELDFDWPDNQAPGCGMWLEAEVFITNPDGTGLSTFYLVLQRSKGTISGNHVIYTFRDTDPAPFGNLLTAGFLFPGRKTRMRVRSTNFRGVRSQWSGMQTLCGPSGIGC